MKTLQQVEPRIDLNRLAGDASTVCIITGPGSYYLSADLTGAAAKDTIRVGSAGRVTIDLNGFALTNTGSGRSSILLPSANDAVTIYNGTILASGAGTKAIAGAGTRVVCRDLQIVAGKSKAIELGDECVILRCQISNGSGLSAGLRCSMRETRVTGTADFEITLGDEAAVEDGVFSMGDVQENSNISGCTVLGAQIGGILSQAANVSVSRCTLSGNKGGGISLLSGTVFDCDVAGTTSGAVSWSSSDRSFRTTAWKAAMEPASRSRPVAITGSTTTTSPTTCAASTSTPRGT